MITLILRLKKWKMWKTSIFLDKNVEDKEQKRDSNSLNDELEGLGDKTKK
jgi:hypothetical protein